MGGLTRHIRLCHLLTDHRAQPQHKPSEVAIFCKHKLLSTPPLGDELSTMWNVACVAYRSSRFFKTCGTKTPRKDRLLDKSSGACRFYRMSCLYSIFRKYFRTPLSCSEVHRPHPQHVFMDRQSRARKGSQKAVRYNVWIFPTWKK